MGVLSRALSMKVGCSRKDITEEVEFKSWKSKTWVKKGEGISGRRRDLNKRT